MHPRLLLPLCLILLTGCLPAASGSAPTPTPRPFDCDAPGSLELLDLPRTPGLAAYHYGLYLPPCYAADTDRLYPIVYLIPGHTSLPQHWFDAGAAQMADELIRSRQVDAFIIVATQNIDEDPQASIITDELMPFVERTYRVSPGRRHHEIAGASLGSIAAYRIGFQHPRQFSSIGVFGGGSYPGEEQETRAWLAAIPAEYKPFVFVNAGAVGDLYMVHRSEILLDMLDEYAIPHAHIFTTGDHSYRYWIRYLPSYIQWAAQDW
jgi:enterochelin esterase-like enzyme